MKVSFKVRMLSAGLVAGLALAACGPADNDLTPGLTDEFETPIGLATEPGLQTPLATEPLATEVVATEVAPTEALATDAPTQGATTPEVTAQATTDATTQPGEEG